LDFTEIFVLVVKPISYKTIFALVIIYNQELEQINIKTIFFYRDIEKNIKIKLPIDYGIISTTKLNKILYSLKQSPRI
jgi:hypothetical protein